ncbi:MAG: hypothetical protein ACI35O_02585 [Bacillaceae bacterium]
MLFHYHFWTPYIEETENFYLQHGFRVHVRIGKYEGEFQSFNPPLTLQDIRDKKILFRIIEMRKGSVNVTFGYGKKVMFDHIGFLVVKAHYNTICEQAKKLQWNVRVGERRTFIDTPYGFAIELQLDESIIDERETSYSIQQMSIMAPNEEMKEGLRQLLGELSEQITRIPAEFVTLQQVVIAGIQSSVDPNGVHLRGY